MAPARCLCGFLLHSRVDRTLASAVAQARGYPKTRGLLRTPPLWVLSTNRLVSWLTAGIWKLVWSLILPGTQLQRKVRAQVKLNLVGVREPTIDVTDGRRGWRDCWRGCRNWGRIWLGAPWLDETEPRVPTPLLRRKGQAMTSAQNSGTRPVKTGTKNRDSHL